MLWVSYTNGNQFPLIMLTTIPIVECHNQNLNTYTNSPILNYLVDSYTNWVIPSNNNSDTNSCTNSLMVCYTNEGIPIVMPMVIPITNIYLYCT